MAFEALTDEKIISLENWAENKKKTMMTEDEKKIVNRIEAMKKDNWRGYRLKNKSLTKAEAQEQLEQLRGPKGA